MINQVFAKKNLPVILGSKSFVEMVKENFFNSNNFEDVPETKRLAPDIEKIKTAVFRDYDIKEDELYSTKRGFFNEPRNVAVNDKGSNLCLTLN